MAHPVPIQHSLQRQFGPDQRTFPLLLSPPSPEFDLFDWLTREQAYLDRLLHDHHGIVFRSFPQLTSFEAFHAAVEASGLQGMDYLGGAAVRTQLTSRVFTANESPSTEKIPFHHEMAQTPHPPTHLFFYCDVPPTEGGETPILLSFEIYDQLNARYPEVMKEIAEKGVKYIRVMPSEDDPTSAIGRGWKSTFLCSTPVEAEAALQRMGSTWEWLENGDLKTISAVLPAIRHDDKHDIQVFFNSIIAAYKGWNDQRNHGEDAVQLGDGQSLNKEFLEYTADLMDAISVALPWQAGDLLLLNNRTAMHSRKPFMGPRKILASLVRDPAR